MRTKWFRRLFLMSCCLSLVAPVYAQGEACPTFVSQALEMTGDVCNATGRNQLCYGNSSLEVTPRLENEPLTFEQPGDIVNVTDIQRLRSAPLDETNDVWGVALMRLQSNLPAVLPGQAVTIVLYGDAEILDSSPGDAAPVTMDITADKGMNVRSGPSTDYVLAGSLAAGDTALADGRLADGSWLRIQIEQGTGWVFAPLVSPVDDGNLDDLPVVTTGESANLLQGFYIRTGLGDAACSEMPNSGVLIQTPEGIGEISLNINEVSIRLASTAFIEAQAGAEMRINMVEGRGRIEAQGLEQIALRGTSITVPLNERLQAAGPPSPPRLCLAADMQGLPVDSWSCDLVEVHQDYECPAMIPSGARVLISRPIPGGPFTEAQIDDMIANSPSTMEINGQSVPFQNARYPADNGLTGYDLQYNWTAPDPGVYVVTGSSLGTSYSCTLTVV